MSLHLTELEGMRDALLRAIGGGALQVEFNGRAITYRSVTDMQAALVSLDREIVNLGGRERPRQIVITPKGI